MSRARAKASRSVTVVNRAGMHARPAAELVKLAGGYGAHVTVASGSASADAKSILGLLSLAAERGTTLEVSAWGEDAAEAVDAVAALIADGFSEDV